MFRLIQNVNVFRGGGWRSSQLLLAGTEIALLDDTLELLIPGLTVTDGQGMYAIAGYVDRHVHITGGGGEGGFSNEVAPLRAEALVRAGVTTVVGLLGTDGTTRSVESLCAKAMALEEEGITARFLTGSYDYPAPTITGSVKRDILMLPDCIGTKIAIADHRSACIQDWELARLAADTWQAGVLKGRPAFVHLHVGRGKDGLAPVFRVLEKSDLPVEAFHPTHLWNQREDAVRFSNMGGWTDFTVAADPDASAQQLLWALSHCRADRVTCSTDANGSMPVWNSHQQMIGISACQCTNLHESVRALVRSGALPLEQAIRPCTCNAARALSMPRKGALRPGMDADILLLDDELKIQSVYAGGRELLHLGKLTFTPKFSMERVEDEKQGDGDEA